MVITLNNVESPSWCGYVHYKDHELNQIDLKTPSLNENNSEFGAKEVDLIHSWVLMNQSTYKFSKVWID